MPLKKHLFGLLVVAILSGVASYSNVAKQFQLASVSGCYTQSQIDELTKEKATLDLGIENNTKLYNSAVSEIERLTALLTPSSTISAKYTEAINYLNIRNASRKNPKVSKRYNTLYTTAIASYNTMVTNNTSYSSQITKFTADKTTYQNNINTLSTVLAGTLSEITTANSNKCSTTTTTGTTTTTTSSYVADTGSHSICSTDEECTNGETCISSMCVTPGSDRCETSADCHEGDECSAGNCTTPDDITTTGGTACCVCYYHNGSTDKQGDTRICTDQMTNVKCDEQYTIPKAKVNGTIVDAVVDSKMAINTCSELIDDIDKDQISIFYSDHSNEQECHAMWTDAYAMINAGISGGITDCGCNGADDYNEKMAFAKDTSDWMIVRGYEGTIRFTANQNISVFDPKTGTQVCGMPITYIVNKDGVSVEPGDCPKVGDPCATDGGGRSDTGLCTEDDGEIAQYTCVPNESTGGFDVVDGSNAINGKYQKK